MCVTALQPLAWPGDSQSYEYFGSVLVNKAISQRETDFTSKIFQSKNWADFTIMKKKQNSRTGGAWNPFLIPFINTIDIYSLLVNEFNSGIVSCVYYSDIYYTRLLTWDPTIALLSNTSNIPRKRHRWQVNLNYNKTMKFSCKSLCFENCQFKICNKTIPWIIEKSHVQSPIFHPVSPSGSTQW